MACSERHVPGRVVLRAIPCEDFDRAERAIFRWSVRYAEGAEGRDPAECAATLHETPYEPPLGGGAVLGGALVATGRTAFVAVHAIGAARNTSGETLTSQFA